MGCSTDFVPDNTEDKPVSQRPVADVAKRKWERVQAEQFQKGLDKYGRVLTTNNGRNPYRDAREELVDLHQYLTQAEMEHTDTLIDLVLAQEDVRQLRAEANDASVDAGCLLDDLVAERGRRLAERQRRRDNVQRAWTYRRHREEFFQQTRRAIAARLDAQAERDAAFQRAERLLAGLRANEWIDTPEAGYWCASCYWQTTKTHDPDCWLAALIRDAEGA